MLKKLGERFFRERILSDEFIDAIQRNLQPMNELMAYYRYMKVY